MVQVDVIELAQCNLTDPFRDASRREEHRSFRRINAVKPVRYFAPATFYFSKRRDNEGSLFGDRVRDSRTRFLLSRFRIVPSRTFPASAPFADAGRIRFRYS